MMRNICRVVGVLLLTSASLTAQTPFESGNKAYAARDFKQAISYYERAVMDEPANVDLQVKLANCYRYLNDMDKSESYYGMVTQNPSSAPINHYWYAMVLKSNKKYDKAIQALTVYGQYGADLAQKAQASCTFAKNNLNTQSAFFVAKETAISSPTYDDYAPVFHRGNVLLTSSRKINFASLPGGFSDPARQNFIYKAAIGTTGSLGDLKIIKGEQMFLPASNLAPFDITTDEKRGASTFNMFVDGQRHVRGATLTGLEMEIHAMERLEDFVPGKKLPFLDDNTSASFPSFANNGNTLYFAADGIAGSQGGYDIYVTYYQNGTWTTPQNLGPNVNTAGDEICPHIANNGDLYFASDFHKGFGGYDVFRSKKVGSTWQDVRNLGSQVNTSADDMYFIFDASKRVGYFASNRNGNYDIYSAALRGDESLLIPVNDAEVAVVVPTPNVVTPTPNPNPVVVTPTPNPNNNVVNPNTTYPTTNPNTTYPTTNPNNNTVGNTSTNYGTNPNNTVVTTTPPNNTVIVTNPNTTLPVGNSPTVGSNPPGTVPCAMNFYIGGIVDGDNKRPLADAMIYIRNRKTGEERKIKEPTNLYGEYSVILDPLTDYTVAISKAGFKNLVFDVNTGTGGKKTLLNTRPMYAAGTVVRDKWGNIVEGGTVSTDETVAPIETPTTSQLMNTPTSSKYFSQQSDGRPIPSQGYMIQALATKELSAAQRFELSKYGNLISEKKGDLTVYRVGVFVDEAHLDANLVEVRKTYKDAFKVPVDLNTNSLGGKIAASSQVVYPPMAALPEGVTGRGGEPMNNNYNNQNTAPTSQTPIIKENDYDSWANNPTEVTSTPNRLESGVEFKVQLGAYSKPEVISFASINHLGLIEQRKQGNGLTYFYITGFKTIEKARAARVEAQAKVGGAPFLVAFKDGVKVNISDVVAE